ncbi:MAG: dockerin type I repeat-containing protein [Clostridia bacterium]|nr:dockerin type I repeat-containing protein [Clostridia bacterium]
MNVKKLLALLIAALMLASAMPAYSQVGNEPASKVGSGVQPDEDNGGRIVIEAKASEGEEPERTLSAHGSYSISFYPRDDGAYYGDYIVIYNPDYTDGTGKSTGSLNGLIETSVTAHLDAAKVDEFEEDLCEDDCMYCGTPEAMDEYVETERIEDEPQGERVSFSVGSTRDFTLTQSPTSSSTINFTCLAVGTHCYVWTPTDKTTQVLYPLDQIDSGYADTFAAEFDSKFDLMRSSFGDHWNDTLGDGRVHLMFYNIKHEGWLGFFTPQNYTDNHMPMINIDTYPAILTASGDVKDASTAFNTIVHEYQHLIHYSVCRAQNKSTEHMLTEMMSAAAEEICYPGSSLSMRIPHWLGESSTVSIFNNPYFEHKNKLYYGSSGVLGLYDWYATDGFNAVSQYGKVSLYAQFLYTHLGGNTVFSTILNEYATHSDYSSGDAVDAVIRSRAADYSYNTAAFNGAFWAGMTANPAEGFSESPNLYSLYGFKQQDGYDPANYHGVANLYNLLCPLIYTGTNARTIQGGAALVVKPVNGRFVPPSDASSGLWYIGIFTNEKLHHDTVSGELETCVFSGRGYPFMPVDGAAKSTNAGVANSHAYVTYYCREEAGSIRFRVKVSGEGSNDRPYDGLNVYFNGLTDDDVVLQLATTNGAWQDYEITLPSGYSSYLMFFEYFKDNSVNSGDDCALIDDVEFVPRHDPSLNEALNYEGGSITFTTGSDYPFCVGFYNADDVGVSGNGGVGDSVSYVTCRVPMYMGDSLSFEYYYSTEEDYDFFDFYVNGASYMHLSGPENRWQFYTFTAYTEGIFTFTWQYRKDATGNLNNDCVMIDNVRHMISPEQTYSVDYSLNASGGDLHFTTGGSPSFWADYWYEDSIVTAGNYGRPSTAATIRTSVTMYSGDELRFEYYVSSEENYDWFEFTVNGETEMYLSGNLGWNTYRYSARETGEYNFVWSYTKDVSVDKYMDTVKLDNVEHFKVTPHLNTALNADGTDVWLNFVSTGDYPFCVNRDNVYSLYAESSNNIVDSSCSSMTSSVYLNAGDELSFYYYLESEDGYDWFDFYVNGTRVLSRSGDVGEEYYTYTMPSSRVYTFEWRYTKDNSQSYGYDGVMLYRVKVDASGGLLGDADGNGIVNSTDALLILRYSLGILSTLPNMPMADADGNGLVNSGDALLVLRAALGIITL